MNPYELRKAAGAIKDWWAIAVGDLESLALGLLGPRDGGWVRKGPHRAIIDGNRYGSDAPAIEDELKELSVRTRAIMSESRESVVLAAAYYHVRFGNIHPLYDGNGRIGRLMIAGQLRSTLGFSANELERGIISERDAYRAAFKRRGGRETLIGLTEILMRVTRCGKAPLINITDQQLRPLRSSRGALPPVGRRYS